MHASLPALRLAGGLWLVLALGAHGARAAEGPPAGAPGGWFAQLYTGLGLTEDSALRVTVPAKGLDLTFSDVSWEDYSLSQPSIPYIGARIGRWSPRRPWLGLAIDVIHFKVFARTDRRVAISGALEGRQVRGRAPLGQLIERYNVGNGVNLYMLTALVRQRRGRSAEHPDGRWHPYAGIGLGAAVLYTHSTVLDDSREGYEAGKAAGQLLAGVELRLGPRFALFGEVKRTRTDANGSVAGGGSATRLDSSHYVFGGSYRWR